MTMTIALVALALVTITIAYFWAIAIENSKDVEPSETLWDI